MSADNELTAKLRFLSGVLRTEGAINASDDVLRAVAESDRQRGEVDACISPDWVIGYFPADVAEEVKRAVRDAFGEWNALSPKPAPAMPNGVEGLVAEWEALIAHPDTSVIMRNTLEHVVRQVRAADNRDAAGVATIRAEEYTRGRCDGWEAARSTTAAVPAGEAVAWIRDNLPESLHGMGVVDVLQLLLDGGIAAEKDLIDAESPQPADGGAVDFWVCPDCTHYYMTDGVICDCHGRAGQQRMRHVRMVPMVTTPPAAQVQQEAAYWERWHPDHGVGSINREPLGRSLGDTRWVDRPLYRHAHPAAGDKVRELVAKWRDRYESLIERGRLGDGYRVAGNNVKLCADELQAALAQPQEAAHPSACELRAVLTEIRAAADSGGANEGQCYNWWRKFESALQHRGDSQEVGRG